MSRATHDSFFRIAIHLAALLTLPTFAHAEPPATEVIIAPVVIQIPKIEVFGLAEPEDLKSTEKTPIQKMQVSLDKAGRTGNFLVRDYGYNDSTRRAHINTLSGLYCLEEKRGQIDFSGMNQARIGVAMRPVINDCR
jgi:hypothetical protein